MARSERPRRGPAVQIGGSQPRSSRTSGLPSRRRSGRGFRATGCRAFRSFPASGRRGPFISQHPRHGPPRILGHPSHCRSFRGIRARARSPYRGFPATDSSVRRFHIDPSRKSRGNRLANNTAHNPHAARRREDNPKWQIRSQSTQKKRPRRYLGRLTCGKARRRKAAAATACAGVSRRWPT